MKNFRKNQANLFVCEECNVTYEAMNNFSRHIGKYHNKKDYYDKWLKEDGEGICLICKKESRFSNKFNIGYKNCCSAECVKIYNRQMFEKGMMEIHGTIIPMRIKKSRDKYEETMMQRYNTIIPAKNKNISNKILATMNLRYGNNAPIQNKEIFDKTFKTRILIHLYKDTNLTYQGSYELDFIDKYHDKYSIQNGPSIIYFFENKKHIYHSDFYISSLNLVIEIKSSYILKIDENVEAKRLAVIAAGFNYIKSMKMLKPRD